MNRTLGIAFVAAACLLAAGTPCRAADGDAKAPTQIAAFDFETPAEATAWHDEPHAGEPPSIIALDPVNPHSGRYSLKFGVERDAAAMHDAYSPITLTDMAAGRRLIVDFYARTAKVQAGEAAFRVLEWTNHKPVQWIDGKVDFIPLNGGEGWTKYHAEAPLSDKTDDILIYLALPKPGAGAAIWLDDFTAAIRH